MKRNTVLKVLNPVLALLAVNQVATGLFRRSLSYETFELLHETGGIVFAVAAVAHVVLNWTWIKAGFFGPRGRGGA